MRPRTRVTLTSLTGVLLESILKERALSSDDEGGENLGGLEEEADVKMILPCVGSKLREGSGLLTPEPSGTHADSVDLHRHLIIQAVNHVPFSLAVSPCGPAHYSRISTIVRVKSQKNNSIPSQLPSCLYPRGPFLQYQLLSTPGDLGPLVPADVGTFASTPIAAPPISAAKSSLPDIHPAQLQLSRDTVPVSCN